MERAYLACCRHFSNRPQSVWPVCPCGPDCSPRPVLDCSPCPGLASADAVHLQSAPQIRLLIQWHRQYLTECQAIQHSGIVHTQYTERETLAPLTNKSNNLHSLCLSTNQRSRQTLPKVNKPYCLSNIKILSSHADISHAGAQRVFQLFGVRCWGRDKEVGN